MATTTSSCCIAIAVAEPVFTHQERLALAGFLSGYTGLTREAYALDLRQFAAWCQQRHLRLFQARRADIECFARDLEARGRARATITRRLCTVAGLYRYAVEEDLLEHSPAAHVRGPRLDYESHATGWTATSSARCWSPPGLARLPSTRWSRCWRSTGCACPKPSAPTSRPWASSADTGPWWLPARAARSSPSRWRRAPRGRSTWPSASAGGASLPSRRRAAARSPRRRADRPPGRPPRRDRQTGRAAHPCGTRSSPPR